MMLHALIWSSPPGAFTQLPSDCRPAFRNGHGHGRARRGLGMKGAGGITVVRMQNAEEKAMRGYVLMLKQKQGDAGFAKALQKA